MLPTARRSCEGPGADWEGKPRVIGATVEVKPSCSMQPAVPSSSTTSEESDDAWTEDGVTEVSRAPNRGRSRGDAGADGERKPRGLGADEVEEPGCSQQPAMPSSSTTSEESDDAWTEDGVT